MQLVLFKGTACGFTWCVIQKVSLNFFFSRCYLCSPKFRIHRNHKGKKNVLYSVSHLPFPDLLIPYLILLFSSPLQLSSSARCPERPGKTTWLHVSWCREPWKNGVFSFCVCNTKFLWDISDKRNSLILYRFLFLLHIPHSFEELICIPEHFPIECMNTSHSKGGKSFYPSPSIPVEDKGASHFSEASKSFL